MPTRSASSRCVRLRLLRISLIRCPMVFIQSLPRIQKFQADSRPNVLRTNTARTIFKLLFTVNVNSTDFLGRRCRLTRSTFYSVSSQTGRSCHSPSGHYRFVDVWLMIPGANLSRLAVVSPETTGKPGEVTEWPIVPVSKTGEPARVPRVQIPPSPLGLLERVDILP